MRIVERRSILSQTGTSAAQLCDRKSSPPEIKDTLIALRAVLGIHVRAICFLLRPLLAAVA